MSKTVSKLKVFSGMVHALGLHIIAALLVTAVFFLFPAAGGAALVFLLGIGGFQVVYIVPQALYFHHKQRRDELIGLLLAAGLTLLLNGLCWSPFFFGR